MYQAPNNFTGFSSSLARIFVFFLFSAKKGVVINLSTYVFSSIFCIVGLVLHKALIKL